MSDDFDRSGRNYLLILIELLIVLSSEIGHDGY